MNTLSSHILDTTSGKPVEGIKLTLSRPDGSTLTGTTDSDGRFKDWGTPFEAGIYTLRFHCDEYLISTHGKSFYPHIDICFELGDEGGHYHVPLLISPFGFSSYRGS
ncbi:MAG TPA: hydroxyisourate hydrolase [Alteromonas australica]|uniref:5-hydroxyisourate hydrolase n=1 Tax=Alteromonas australica TaxID=589873 RepID=A0A349TTH8_9ALTE|nr:hydroxyisourate hydrolase [Alteromonas australica]HAI73639.1 hydroxyisourate hydrolase [Alteromonas australica]HAU27343.1 hydroxyisourate hydrolase [Alteromonas australica]HAW75972.1 hydroxyisourate hydrolase [Alteromonas australica]HBU52557.1 hydroxyisourate hydrolase [Alteromonas australica]|tara:strand:- start:1178 stop:1498 length:321 start_codon:yes stop_codon:yes gene_type:complete